MDAQPNADHDCPGGELYPHPRMRHTAAATSVLTAVSALLRRRVRIRYRVLAHQDLDRLPISQDLPQEGLPAHVLRPAGPHRVLLPRLCRVAAVLLPAL